MSSENTQPMIAIIGIAGRFPKAPDLDAFWTNLKHGIEGITFFSDAELLARGVPAARIKARNFVKAAPVLTGIDQFDASFFGYVPSDARLLDPQQRLFLEIAWHALEHASVDPSTYPGAIGVFGGASLSTYLLFNVLNNPGYSDHENGFEVMVNNDKDFLCTRVAYHFDLRGPSLAVQTGCSTSLVATHLACEALTSFQCDVALAGAVSVNVPQRTGYLYEKDGIASPDGHCRALDARARAPSSAVAWEWSCSSAWRTPSRIATPSTPSSSARRSTTTVPTRSASPHPASMARQRSSCAPGHWRRFLRRPSAMWKRMAPRPAWEIRSRSPR